MTENQFKQEKDTQTHTHTQHMCAERVWGQGDV